MCLFVCLFSRFLPNHLGGQIMPEGRTWPPGCISDLDRPGTLKLSTEAGTYEIIYEVIHSTSSVLSEETAGYTLKQVHICAVKVTFTLIFTLISLRCDSDFPFPVKHYNLNERNLRLWDISASSSTLIRPNMFLFPTRRFFFPSSDSCSASEATLQL